MRWTRFYRLTLWMLPSALRRKHGRAMEDLFASQLERALARGSRFGALTGVAGVWDVVRRGAYERLRVVPRFLRGRGEGPQERRSPNQAGERAGVHLGGLPMSRPTTREILCRHAVAFGVSFVAMTGILLANALEHRLPELWARDHSVAALIEVALLSLPHTMALTIPMAVFMAVQWVFIGLGAEGVLADARREHGRLRRLVAPVLGASLGIAALTFVMNTEVLPRANGQLNAIFLGKEPDLKTDRAMTIPELRAAAEKSRSDAGPRALEHAASYEIEVQKKYALAATSVVLALAGVAVGLCFSRRRIAVVAAVSFVVYAAYWGGLVTGESLADDLALSPVVAMWAMNWVVLAAASLVIWASRRPLGTRSLGSLAMGG
jgi:lipopolysaccharide export LptBFGC system permease protein LptF